MSCPFGNFSNIFGEPGKGVHSVRLLDVAILDVFGTIGIAGLIAYFKNYTTKQFFIVLIILFIMGIILHWMFCVNTTVNKWIFGVV